MKKLLALVLALVMTLSLVTVSNAAYSDAADIDYKEAVDVMSAIGVLQGNGGKFNPDGILTRAEACTIIAKMLGMGTYDGKSNFTDCQGHWGEGAIALCAGEGIVDGVGGGKFDPNGKLTGYAFGKMLLVALGYDAKIEGMTGFDWTIGVAKLIKSLDLNDGIDGFVGSAEVSREVAAQMALNALQCAEVYYGQSESVTNKGEITTSTNLKATKVDGSNPATDPYLELMEDFFPNLVCSASTDGQKDVFGRPANKWTYKGVEVGYYASTPTYTYTKAISTAADVQALKETIKDYANYGTAYDASTAALTILTINGKGHDMNLTSTNSKLNETNIAALTAAGRTVEIYTNPNNNTITAIVATDTVLAKVTAVNDKTKTISYTVTNVGNDFNKNTQTIGYGDYKVGDYVVMTATTDQTDGLLDDANMTIKTVAPATVVTGVANKYNSTLGLITIDGTVYPMAATCWDDAFAANAKFDATLYTDANGFVLYAKAGAAATVDHAVIVTKAYAATNENGAIVPMIEGVTSNGATVNWQYASVGGGTTNLQTAANVAAAGTMYTWADANNDGIYELTAAGTGTTTFSDGSTTYIDNSNHGALTKQTRSLNDQTGGTPKTAFYASDVKFIYVAPTTNKATVVEGASTVASGDDIYVTIKTVGTTNYITAVFVPGVAAPSSATATGDVVFVAGQTGTTSVINKATNAPATFATYKAYVNGELVEDFYAAAGAVSGFYYAKVNANTGAYELTGNEYAATEGAMAVKEDLKVTNAAGNIIATSNGDFDLSGAVIVDATTLDIASVADINTNKTAITVNVMYNVQTGAVSYIYVMPAVSVTVPTGAQTFNTAATYTLTADKAVANVGDTVTFTLVIGGTSDATTAKVLTFAGATLTNGTLTGTGVSNMTSVVISGTNTVTITPTAAAVAGTYTFTGVVTGAVTVS